MNSSLLTADSATHLKIVFVALLAGIVVALIGISAHVTGGNALSARPRLELPIPPSAPKMMPPSGGKVVVV